MKEKKLEVYLFFILLAVAVYLVFSILRPYLPILALALVFAVVFEPLYRKLHSHMKKWDSSAAILTVLLVVCIILVPLVLYGMALAAEIRDLYTNFFASNDYGTVIDQLTTNVNNLVQHYSPFALNGPAFDSTQTQAYLLSVFAWVRGHFGDIFTGLTSFFLNLFLLLVSFYYLLRDGELLKRSVTAISPFNDERDEEIFEKLKRAVMSVIKGSLLIAVIQGILTGFGFFIFGIPSALLWGGIASLAALIPSIGTSLVIVPGIVYLFLSGHVAAGVGLSVWGILTVGLIDNFLASYLVARGAKIHPLLILLSALGGISYFGPLGFIFGPVIISFLFALFDIYKTILVRDVGITK